MARLTSYADHEEAATDLEDFARRAGCGDDLALAAEILVTLYEHTGDDERRLLKGWVVGHVQTRVADMSRPEYEHVGEADEDGLARYVRRETEQDRRWSEGYARFMREAEEQYAGIITRLNYELPQAWHASMWQTGGMCLAIGISRREAPGDAYALLTCAEPLPPDREDPGVDEPEYSRWHLGIYREEGEDDGLYVLPYDFHDAQHDERVAKAVRGILDGESLL